MPDLDLREEMKVICDFLNAKAPKSHEYELWKQHLNSPFCAITADAKSRWPHGSKAYPLPSPSPRQKSLFPPLHGRKAYPPPPPTAEKLIPPPLPHRLDAPSVLHWCPKIRWWDGHLSWHCLMISGMKTKQQQQNERKQKIIKTTTKTKRFDKQQNKLQTP